MRRATARRSSTSIDRATQGDLRRSRLRLIGVALLCVKVALVPLVFDLSLDAPVSVPKALLSHTLSYMLAGVIAGLLIHYGRVFLVWSWLHVPVLAFLGANVAATLVAADPLLALYGTHVRMLGLGTIADWVVLYFAVPTLVRTRGEAAALIACALGASLLILLYEVLQLADRDPFNWNFVGTVNPFSTLGQPTILAHYLTLLSVGAFALGVLVDGLRRSARVVLLVYAGALVAGAGATGTRSTAIGIATGVIVLVTMSWAARRGRGTRVVGLAAAAFGALALTALLILSPIGARFAGTIDTLIDEDSRADLLSRLEPSAAARVALYAIGAQMVLERPILGYGPDNFPVGVPRYRTANEPREIRSSLATSAHSWLGYVATGSGLIGLGAFLGVVVVALGLAARSGMRPLTIAAAAMIGAFLGAGLTTVSDIGTDWLLWASAGAIAATTARASPSAAEALPAAGGARHQRARLERRARPAGVKAIGAWVCALLGVLVALSAVSAYDASRYARQSEDARLLGRVPQSIDLALRATRTDPGRAEYWHDLGLSYVGASRWVEASAAFERASILAPYDVRNIDDHATAQLLLASGGDASARAKAIELVDQAVQIDPNNPQAQLTRAIAMQVTRNLPEAVRSVEKAAALDPTSVSAKLWLTATQIYLDSARPADAARVGRQGIDLLGPSPSSIPVRYELARALVALGQPRDALAVLDFALSIRPYAPAERLRTEIRVGLGN